MKQGEQATETALAVPARQSDPPPTALQAAPVALQAPPADLLLRHRLLAGDEAAFTSLVERHHAALLRVAGIWLTGPAAAEEVVQDTWITVIEKIEGYEGRSSLKTWIFGIVANKARRRGMQDGRTVPFSALADDPTGEPAVDPSRFRTDGSWAAPPRRCEDDDPERIFLRQEALEQLQRALEELPPNQRAVVTLRDVEGLEAADVCNVLAISETNQRVLLHRGRTRLRDLLAAYLERK